MPRTLTPRTPKKNKSLEFLKFAAEKAAQGMETMYPEFGKQDPADWAHPVAGFAGSLYGLDPDTGEVTNPFTHRFKQIARGEEDAPYQERSYPGLLLDAMDLFNWFGYGPEWSKWAGEQSELLDQRINESMKLAPPHGIKQHALRGFGTMVGQAPLPAGTISKTLGWGKKAVQSTGALDKVKNWAKTAALSPVEWFSPIVDPKLRNYAAGSGFAGAAGGFQDWMTDDPERAVGTLMSILRPPGGMPVDPRLAGPTYKHFDEIRNHRAVQAGVGEFLDDWYQNAYMPEARQRVKEWEDQLPLRYEDIPENDHLPEGEGSPPQGYAKKGLVKKTGKVLEDVLKTISINPDATKDFKGYPIGDPKEEILYSTNEAVRRGLITPMHKEVIKRQLEAGDEAALAESLMRLHEKLFPTTVVPSLPPPQNPLTAPQPAPNPKAGMTQEQWEAMLKKGKAKGGKIQGYANKGKVTGKGEKAIKSSLLKLRERLAAGVDIPPAAGVPQGQELVPMPPTGQLPTTLPPTELPQGFNAPDVDESGALANLSEKLINTPVSRRTVLKGAAGAMLPDIPITPEAVVAKAVKQAVKAPVKPAHFGKPEVGQGLNDFIDTYFEQEEPAFVQGFDLLKQLPGSSLIAQKYKALQDLFDRTYTHPGSSDVEDWAVKEITELEMAIEKYAEESGFRRNPRWDQYGMTDPDIEMTDMDYNHIIPHDYFPTDNLVRKGSAREKELQDRWDRAVEERRREDQEMLAPYREQYTREEAIDRARLLSSQRNMLFHEDEGDFDEEASDELWGEINKLSRAFDLKPDEFGYDIGIHDPDEARKFFSEEQLKARIKEVREKLDDESTDDETYDALIEEIQKLSDALALKRGE